MKGSLLTISRQRFLIALLLFSVGLFSFTTIFRFIVEYQGITPLDSMVLDWIIVNRSPFMTNLMAFITMLLSPISIIILTVVGSSLWAWKKNEFWRPALLTSALGIAFILTDFIKHTVARARPAEIAMVPPFELDFSFPSGHAIGVAVFSLVLGYLLYSRRRSLKVLAILGSLAAAGTLSVALSRMYLGYHWLTDVSASISLALIVLAAVILVDTLQPRAKASSSDR